MMKKRMLWISLVCLALALAPMALATEGDPSVTWTLGWHDAMMRLEDERGQSFYDWTHEERAAFSQTHQLDTAKAAGIEADTVIYVTPPEGGIGEAEALRIARQIVMDDLSVGEEYFARMNVGSQCMTHGDPAKNPVVWRVDVYPMNQTQEEMPIHHVVEMDAMTGEITGGFSYNMNEANG